ncbi:MAG TPA: 50S ribosomal protein L29, partial [Chthoniobacterales bacterium]
QITGPDEVPQPSPRCGLAKMKLKELQDMGTDELLTKKRDLRQESLHLRLQQQSGQLEQPSRLRLLRRDVARIETLLTRRNKEAAAKK